MDSKTENEVSHNLEQCFHQDATHYAVNYSHGRKTNEVNDLLLCSAHLFTTCLWGKKCMCLICRCFLIKLKISLRSGRCAFNLSITACFFSAI